VNWPGKTVLKFLPHSPKTTDLQLGRPAKVVTGIRFSLDKMLQSILRRCPALPTRGKPGFYARSKDDEQEMLQKQPALQGLSKAKEKEGNFHGRP
jgi:hypothetical protein